MEWLVLYAVVLGGGGGLDPGHNPLNAPWWVWLAGGLVGVACGAFGTWMNRPR